MGSYVFYIVEYSFPSDDEVIEKTISEVRGISLLTALKHLGDFVKEHPEGRLNTDMGSAIEYETEDTKLSAFIEYEED